MSPFFGMAGLAEAVEAESLVVGYGCLLFLVLGTVVAVLSRSCIVAGIVLAAAFVVTVMFMPPAAFLPHESNDPDVHYWVAAWRDFAWRWTVATMATVAASLWVFALHARCATRQAASSQSLRESTEA